MPRSPLARHWDLDPDVVFLNHGSFGATPRVVLEAQAALRAELEAEPVRFLYRELEGRLDAARVRLAALVGADPEGLAFVPNATTGVNTALAAAGLGPGDEVLMLDPEYNATANAARRACAAAGATLRIVALPFPTTPEEVVERVLAAVGPRTRLAVLDHIVSQTALVLPLEALVPALRERGVDTLVDGAHGPGQVPLALEALGAAWYTGNCHKWLCSPKGSALLWVRADKRAATRPLVTSHGANAERPGRSRFRLEHDWVGTLDPTAYLCIPAAIDALASLRGTPDPDLTAHMAANRAAALAARDRLAAALGLGPASVAPDAMVGSMAAVPLPPPTAASPPIPSTGPLDMAPLQDALWTRHRIEVPVIAMPAPTPRLVRVSAQAYNDPSEVELLAGAVSELLRMGL